MHKGYIVGIRERHQVEFRLSWWTGLVRILLDGKAVFTAPFFLKIDHSFEAGKEERHLVRIQYNVFNYFGDAFRMTVDGHEPVASTEIRQKQRPHTAVEDAAAAFLYLVAVNVIFSVIGTLFVPDLEPLQVRLLLLLGALLYLLFAVKTLQRQSCGLIFGTAFFLLDTGVTLCFYPTVGGVLVRGFILYYLLMGLREMKRKNTFEARMRLDAA